MSRSSSVLAEISRSISLYIVLFLLYYCLLHVNSFFLAVIVTNLKYWNTVNHSNDLISCDTKVTYGENFLKLLFFCELWVGRP